MMRQIVIIAATAAVIVLLVGILAAIIHLERAGITVNVTGSVGLENATGGIDLSMPQPVNLVATGPENQPVPADLSIFRCPKCGGTMLPVRFNVINGEITWKCTKCGYTIKGDGEQSP
ncbi:hypothetical protein J7K60_05300 [Candidatus Bipolaricaulota bacterium]|nr:hypothetical protein [Candidatus Bipolaricaulota bacterium]HHR86342.1 hypothetical protein [Candidatus Acetothermia bacterium]